MTTPTTGRAAALTSLALSLTLAAGSYGMRCPGGSSGALSQVSAKLAGS